MSLALDIESAFADLTAAYEHDHPLRMKGVADPAQLRVPAAVARLQPLVSSATSAEFEALLPLLRSSIEVALRQNVLRRMEAIDPEHAAELLVAAAEANPDVYSMEPATPSPVGALLLTLDEISTYVAAVKLRAALTARKQRLKVLVNRVNKFDKESLDDGIASLGMDGEEVDKARAALAAGKSTPLAKLKTALAQVDAEILRVVPELEAFTARVQASRKRAYGDALYILANLAPHTDVSPSVFAYALREYEGQNEWECALSGLKRLATRYLREARHQDFVAMRAFLREHGGEPPVLAKHFDSLS